MVRMRTAARVVIGGLLAALIATPLIAVQPSSAATIAAQRLQLWDKYTEASGDYDASWKMYKPLPAVDKKYVGGKIATGMSALKKVRPLIVAAKTPTSMRRAQAAMATASARAEATRSAVWLLRSAMGAREKARAKINSNLSSYVSRGISEATYRRSAAAAAAVSTRVEAERKAALASLGGTVRPRGAGAASAASAYAGGNFSITGVAGWSGVPGGCAVRAVDTARWLGNARDPGPHLWTTASWESSARAMRGRDAEFDDAYDQMVRGGQNEAAKSVNWSSVVAARYLPKRSQFLGFLWRETGSTQARTALLRDVQTVVRRGPIDTTLQSAMTLEAMATAIDLTQPTGTSRDLIIDQLVVKWLGPASCQIADRSSWVFGSYNIPVVHNTAHAFGAIVAAERYPALAASILAASLSAVRPGLSVVAADGGSPEGPDYWNYQGRYAAGLYATVSAVYGASPPISLPDMSRTTRYWWSIQATNGQTLTHSDSGDVAVRPFLPAWWGFAKGDRAGSAALVKRAENSPEPWSIWWWPRSGYSPSAAASGLYPRTGVAVLHAQGATAWLKGGSNRTNHAHLDLGTVGYSSKGVLWAVDPYKAAYSSAYFDRATRWNFWEASTRSHSTLRVGGTDNMWSGASASFSSFNAGARTVTLNMKQAIKNSTAASRSLAMYSDGRLTISDRVSTSVAQSYLWQWTTDASASVSGRKVVLKHSGQTAVMSFVGLPSGSYVRVIAAPSGKRSAAGLPLRQIQVVTPKVRSLAITATIG